MKLKQAEAILDALDGLTTEEWKRLKMQMDFLERFGMSQGIMHSKSEPLKKYVLLNLAVHIEEFNQRNASGEMRYRPMDVSEIVLPSDLDHGLGG